MRKMTATLLLANTNYDHILKCWNFFRKLEEASSGSKRAEEIPSNQKLLEPSGMSTWHATIGR